MLLTRVLAALVFTPAMLVLVWLGGAYVAAACFVIALLATWEFMSLVFAADRYSIVIGLGLGALVAATTLGWLPVALAPLVAMVALSTTLCRPDPIASSVSRAGFLALGALYGGGLITYLARLRGLDHGVGLAILALLSAWGADTGAYFAGRMFGRHKLYPKISPAKTVEGGIGGIVWAIGGALLVNLVLPTGLTYVQLAIAGVLAAVFGAIGDLCESMVKRAVGAKDSSRLIPGHGGVLDRFDALMFAAPAVYAFVTLAR